MMADAKAVSAAAGSIKPCLVFNERGEEAVKLYVSVFKNSKVESMQLSDGSGAIPKGRLMSATFELDGREFLAFDGGPTFNFAEGISLMVTCETQEEIDHVWGKLSEGGEEGRCGWLKDRFGASWQVVPWELGHWLGDAKGGNSAAALQAMLQMKKLDIASLKRAYESGS
jgi:predicted 3-demethylubiquinone-9 3-methyltransferase (glyoxalase superfamily)